MMAKKKKTAKERPEAAVSPKDKAAAAGSGTEASSPPEKKAAEAGSGNEIVKLKRPVKCGGTWHKIGEKISLPKDVLARLKAKGAV